MTQLQAQRIRPAYEGWNTEAAPDYLGEAQAPLVQNLLCRVGKLTMRGPIYQCADNEAFRIATAARLSGVLVKGTKALSQHGTTSSRYLDLVAKTSSALGLMNPILPRSIELDGFTYGSFARGTGQGLLRWPGTAVLPTDLLAVAPAGSADVVGHLERVFTIGGEISGVAGGTNSVMWSDPAGPKTGVLAEWQDNVSGLYNQIVVGAKDGDELTAAGKVGRDLALFKQRSMYVLRGQTPASFSVSTVSDEVGCTFPSSVVPYRDGIFFMSGRGLMWYDGSELSLVSKQITTPLLNALLGVLGSLTVTASINRVTGGVLGAGVFPICNLVNLGNNMLYLNLGQIIVSGTTSFVPYFDALYDINARTWTKFQSSVITGTQNHFYVGGRPVLIDNHDMFFGDSVPVPEAAVASGITCGVDSNAAGNATIQAKWHSRLIKLASPTHVAQLHRILWDYRMDVGSGTPAWQVSVRRGDGTTAVAMYQVPGEAAGAPTYLARRRDSKDVFAESVDIQLRVEWTNAITPLTLAEIYDATIEFQTTHQRGLA